MPQTTPPFYHLVYVPICITLGCALEAAPPQGADATSGSGEAEVRRQDSVLVDRTDDNDSTESEQAWPEPVQIVPEAPREPGIHDCAPVFIDPDGVCRPRMEACRDDQLVIPSMGCIDPVRVPVDAASDVTVLEVYADQEVAAGLGPGLAEVVMLAPPGSVLQLHAGIVHGDLTIDKPLTLQGQGAGSTRIEGTGEVTYALAVEHAEVTVMDLSIHGAHNAVAATDGATLVLGRTLLAGTVAVSVADSTLEMRDSRVLVSTVHSVLGSRSALHLDGVALPPPDLGGCNFVMEADNPPARIQDSIIAGPSATCWAGTAEMFASSSRIDAIGLPRSNVHLDHVYTHGNNGEVTPVDYEIRHSRIEGRFHVQSGMVLTDSVFVVSPAEPNEIAPIALGLGDRAALLERVEIWGAQGVAIGRAFSATEPTGWTLRDVWIHGATPANGKPGIGIRMAGLVHCVAEDVVIEGASDVGLMVHTSGAIDATRLLIDGSAPRDEGMHRFGIMASSGAHLRLRDVVVSKSTGIGVWLKDRTSRLSGEGLWIDRVHAGSIVDIDQGVIAGMADGLLVTEGAAVDFAQLNIRGAGRASLFTVGASGMVNVGHFADCEHGIATTDPLDQWTYVGLENECIVPFWSSSELKVPKRVTL